MAKIRQNFHEHFNFKQKHTDPFSTISIDYTLNPLMRYVKFKTRAWLVVGEEKDNIYNFQFFIFNSCLHAMTYHTITICLKLKTASNWFAGRKAWHFQFEYRLCCIMKTIFLCIFFLTSFSVKCKASIWIKNVKLYGPTAAQVGVNCLAIMSKLYSKEYTMTRSRIMVVSYTRNLSIPADNIQRLYLKWVHEAIISNELDEYDSQIFSNWNFCSIFILIFFLLD